MSVDKGFTQGLIWGFTIVFIPMTVFCFGLIKMAHDDKELQVYEHCAKAGNFLFSDRKRLIKCEIK